MKRNNYLVVRKKKKKDMECESLPSDDDFQENKTATPIAKGVKETKARIFKEETGTPLKKSHTPIKRSSRRRILNDD